MKQTRTQNTVVRPAEHEPRNHVGQKIDHHMAVMPPMTVTEGSQKAADGTNTPPGRGSTNAPMPDNTGPTKSSGDMGLGVM